MRSSVDDGPVPPIEIKLSRGKTGLGFNIKGGKDMQLLKGDDGIYVAKIKSDGAAYVDGRLKVGDKILKVNEHSLESVKHEEAVDVFVKAGASVTMTVIPGEEARSRKRSAQAELDRNSSPRSYFPYIVVGVAAVVVGVVLFTRFKASR